MDLDIYLKKKHSALNRKWKSMVAFMFGKKILYISLLMTVVLMGMYAHSLFTQKPFPYFAIVLVIATGAFIQFFFARREAEIIGKKKVETNLNASGRATLKIDLEKFYAEEKVGKSFARYNLRGLKVKGLIDDAIIVELADGKEYILIDEENELKRSKVEAALANMEFEFRNDFFEKGKKEISFDDCIKVEEDFNDVVRSVVKSKYREVHDFVKGFDKLYIPYAIFLFTMLGTVLARGNKASIVVIGTSALLGLVAAKCSQKARLDFKVSEPKNRTLNIFKTGVYCVDSFVEEYYSFNDVYKAEVLDNKVSLSFGIGETIVFDKSVFDNNRELFEKIEDKILGESNKAKVLA